VAVLTVGQPTDIVLSKPGLLFIFGRCPSRGLEIAMEKIKISPIGIGYSLFDRFVILPEQRVDVVQLF
jgi:hypothetical protein